MLNIPTYIEDPTYRYKMPALVTRVEGRGNGVKTNLVNLADVARALVVPTEYPLRFFGAELGANIDFKAKEEKATINGSFRTPDLQTLLNKFIEKFVLCPRCHYPELRIIVKKKDLIGNCAACGNRSGVDLTHKLSSYIQKNPPPKTLKGRINETKTSVKSKPKKTKEPVMKKLTLDSPMISDIIQHVTGNADRPVEALIQDLNTMTLTANLEADTKIYVVLHALFGENITRALKDPNRVEVLAKASEGLGEEFLSAFAAVYAGKEEVTDWIPTIFKLLYDAEVVDEETLDAWHHDQLAFSDDFITYNPDKADAIKAACADFLNWLQAAEEEEEEDEDEEEEEEEEAQPAAKEEPPKAAEPEPVASEEVQEEVKADVQEEVKQEDAGPSQLNLLANLDHDEDIDIDDI